MDEAREFLRPYNGAKVTVIGLIAKAPDSAPKSGPTVLVKDVVITTLDGKDWDNADHVWIQNAYDFVKQEAMQGDRFKCTCRVRDYEKMIDGKQTKCYGLVTPGEVKLTSMMPRAARPAEEEEGAPQPDWSVPQEEPKRETNMTPDPAMLLKLMQLIKACGGLREAKQTLERARQFYALVPDDAQLSAYLEFLEELRSLQG